MLEIVAWSFWAMGTGRFPAHDPWGREFDASYEPKRWRLAGSLLAGGWRGAFCGVQADQEYLKKIFDLQRFSVEIGSYSSVPRELLAQELLPLLLGQCLWPR